ncbi:hypothetical protein D3C86_1811860 [compost metagenome]
MELRRKKRPNGVTRSSSRVAWRTSRSSCRRIERNFQTLITSPLQPWRFCMNNTGPAEVSLTVIATTNSNGLRTRMAIAARLRSNRSLQNRLAGCELSRLSLR